MGSNFKKYHGVLVGELTKQKILKEKERVKGALMAQYNSDLIDVALNPAEARREKALHDSTQKNNDQPVGRAGFKNKFGTNVP